MDPVGLRHRERGVGGALEEERESMHIKLGGNGGKIGKELQRRKGDGFAQSTS